MKFVATLFDGAWLIEPERHEDARGHFARIWCKREFAEHGLCDNFVQASTSYNRRAGTLRGMHFQAAPHEEAKLVRCTRGCIRDVIVDLRAGSVTRGNWQSFELSEGNGRALHVPKGFAHGFITLTDAAEVSYQMTEFYHPQCSGGFRWDDPAVGINWQADVCVISPRDEQLPLLEHVLLQAA